MISPIVIFILSIVSSAFAYGQTCRLCLIDSSCDDDYIHFNVSVTDGCLQPLTIYFSYVIDIAAKRWYLNTTINGVHRYADLAIDAVKNRSEERRVGKEC